MYLNTSVGSRKDTDVIGHFIMQRRETQGHAWGADSVCMLGLVVRLASMLPCTSSTHLLVSSTTEQSFCLAPFGGHV